MQIPVLGIVAEYNPFHKGHEYHITESIKRTKAESVVIVLSSDFVQRGEAALTSKWNRAEIALKSGADLVIELPSVFSAHNAGVFANASVDLLNATGIISHMSFGSEDSKWYTQNILDILIDEPEDFKSALRFFLNKGHSFVEARSLALDKLVPGTHERVKKSNNLLGISYLKRLRELNSPISPVTIERKGSDYNDTELSALSSATAIRRAIYAGECTKALNELPEASAVMLSEALRDGKAVISDKKLWNLLRYRLLSSTPEELADIAEISEGIEFKLRDEAIKAKSFGEWTDICTSRRYPSSRIKRHAIHTLLGLDHWTNRALQRLSVPYIRVLGMTRNGQELLRRMKTTATLPVITKYGEAASVSSYAKKIMDYELKACELWAQLTESEEYGQEHKNSIIIIK